MERLTKRYIPNDEKNGISGIKVFEFEDKIPLVEVLSGEYLYPAIEKLATYEDLEEQGLLVRLPCKVGTVVYRIENCGWSKSSVCGKSFSDDCEYCEKKNCDSHEIYDIFSQEMISQDWIFGNRKSFGKTVFLTREEAKKKLEEMKEKWLK